MDPLVNLLVTLRLPLASASVLSILIKERRPMALSDLVEATGYTKSHLSSAIRLLEEKALVERLMVRGRRHLFRAKKGGLAALVREHLSEIYSHLRSVIMENESLSSTVQALEKELRFLLARIEEVSEE